MDLKDPSAKTMNRLLRAPGPWLLLLLLATGLSADEGLRLRPDPSVLAVRASTLPSALEAGAERWERFGSLEDLGVGLYRPAATASNSVHATAEIVRLPGVRWASPLYRSASGARYIPRGRIIARFSSEEAARHAASAVGLRLDGRLAPGEWFLAGSHGPALIEAARRLEGEGLAEWAEPDFLFEIERRYVPNDSLFTLQWHLHNEGQLDGRVDVDVDAPEAWDLVSPDPAEALGHPSIVIAVLDSGLTDDHPDLVDNLWFNPDEIPGNGIDDDGNVRVDDVRGWDFLEDGGADGDPGAANGTDNDPSPGNLCDDHGVSVAGVAAARGDNGGEGGTGACGFCRVMGLRIFGGADFASTSGVATALRYAANEGAAIINNSWGPTDPVAPLPSSIGSAIDFAVESGRGGLGTAVFWSAGNNAAEGQVMDTDGYASYERVIAVGAVSDAGQRSRYSEPGDALDLVAPSNDDRFGAEGITTTQTGEVRTGNCVADLYDRRFGGTSSASPLAAGVAGLVLSTVPTMTPAKLQRVLEDSAAQSPPLLSYDPYEHGAGLVNARDAVADVAEGPTFHDLAYECVEDEILLSVRDRGAAGSVEVLVTSLFEPDGETVVLQEVPGRTGLFEGSLSTGWSLDPVADDGLLVIGPEDTLVAEYGGVTDQAVGTCAVAGCIEDPVFDGLQGAEDSPDCSGRGPVLTWDPVTDWGSGGPKQYVIYRSETPDFATQRLFFAGSSSTDWEDFFADPGVTYFYKVRAENDETGCDGPTGGNIDANDVVLSARAGDDTSQGPVTGLVLLRRPADAVVELHWDPVPGAERYDLFRGTFGPDGLDASPACHLGDLAPDTVPEETESPAPRAGLYYLVSVEGPCGISPFGPADVARPLPSSCP